MSDSLAYQRYVYDTAMTDTRTNVEEPTYKTVQVLEQKQVPYTVEESVLEPRTVTRFGYRQVTKYENGITIYVTEPYTYLETEYVPVMRPQTKYRLQSEYVNKKVPI